MKIIDANLRIIHNRCVKVINEIYFKSGNKTYLVLFQTNKGSSQIRAAVPYLTDQIRAKVLLTLICSGLPLFD